MNINTTTAVRQRRPLPARTPYHSLGDAQRMRVPSWAQHRSVYRSEGRTLYLVETDSLAEAREDLALLNRAGWNVRVTADPESPAGSHARVTLTRPDFARAA